MSLILVTPTNPGFATWTDASLVPTPPAVPAIPSVIASIKRVGA